MANVGLTSPDKPSPVRDEPTRQQVQRLAAFLPTTLSRKILTDNLPLPGESLSLIAATLFSDFSGFTSMSEELASDGPRGAEEVTRVLLLTFTAMIDIIHDMGGDISHFYGDAMAVYFPDEDGQAAARALWCAQQMQQLMALSFERVVTNRPPGKNPFFPLTLKIGAGYGRCQELIVGDVRTQMEFVLTGTAVDEAATAEKQAHAGQIIASRAILTQIGLTATADFQQLPPEPRPVPPRPLLHWDRYQAADYSRLAETAARFIPPALQQRLITASPEHLAEHRPVTSMFVQFELAPASPDLNENQAIVEMGQRLQAYYQWAVQIVARFGSDNGRVNRVLTGDKGNQLHIMFGAPVAPDAPEQAIRCALALQTERPEFIPSQRIGLCVGKVFAGPVGADTRREYTVVGDVVNLSARLTQLCAAGETLTDMVTAERCREVLEFEHRPPMHVKGKQITVQPCRPLGERAGTTQLQAYLAIERPLVDREDELDLLLGGLELAEQGIGGLAAIFGGPGVGKTRLVAEGVDRWSQKGYIRAIGICQPHTADTPYGPWQFIWRSLFGLLPGGDVPAQVTAVQQQTVALLPDIGDDVGLWGDVLGLPLPQTANLADLTAEARQVRLFNLIQRCLYAWAAAHPIHLILENIHWADRASLNLIDHLSQTLHMAPIFLALTFRPGGEEVALTCLKQPICQMIPLTDLLPERARELLFSLAGMRELPLAIEKQLGLRDQEKRDSLVNPLFLQEAFNMLVDVGVLTINGRVHINESLLTLVQIPDTIHGLLLARLDHLHPISRDLLQVASVIGRQFSLEPLSIIAPLVLKPQINELLSSLSAEEMTRLVTAEPEWVYLFEHALTHEVAYESLPYSRRQQLHTGLADWLEAKYAPNLKPLHALLAYHYNRADNHEKGLRYALAAAHDARNIFANTDAIELYTQAEKHLLALGVEGWWETAVELYLARANVFMSLGDLNMAYQDVQRAIDLASNNQARLAIAEALVLTAEIRYRQGQFSEVRDLTTQLFTDFATVASSEQQAKAYIWASWAASSRLDLQTALDYLQKAEIICIGRQNNHLLARVYEAQSYTYYLRKELKLSLTAMLHSVQLSRRFSTPLNLGTALSNVGFVQFMLGQYNEALNTFNEAVKIGYNSGRNLLVMALANRAATLCRLTQFPQALADFEEAISLLEGMSYPGLEVETYLFWGFEYSSKLGHWQYARFQFKQAAEIINLQPGSFVEERARLLLGLGQVELNEGNLTQADQLLQEALILIEQKELAWWRPVADYLIGRLYLVLGKQTEAKMCFESGLSHLAQTGSPDYKSLILHELDKLGDTTKSPG